MKGNARRKASRSGVEVEQGGAILFVDFEYPMDAGRRPLALVAAALEATANRQGLTAVAQKGIKHHPHRNSNETYFMFLS